MFAFTSILKTNRVLGLKLRYVYCYLKLIVNAKSLFWSDLVLFQIFFFIYALAFIHQRKRKNDMFVSIYIHIFYIFSKTLF